ncbi:CAP domain-containing protein [Aeromicrobium sp. CF3.5]|uniref:CAP domain-containing protein n=1 Tax=Aeromicrobium sp. CF3.5 TaxID=3373078 RepID=UPI003EE50A2F
MRALIVALLGCVLVISFTSPASAAMTTWERSAITQVNAERRDAGLGANTAQSCLQRYADIHADRMAAQRKIYHRTTAQLQNLLKRCGLRWIGENLASGPNMSPTTAVRSWMGSTGHRRNLLYASSNRIGSAYTKGSDGRNYWIQLYGRR